MENYDKDYAVSNVKCHLLPHGILPEYKSAGAAGMDLHAALATNEEVNIEPSTGTVIETGVTLAIPDGWEGQVRSRSGLAMNGIVVMNSPGTIDSDYRGEIKVLLFNHGNRMYTVKRGDRIAQLVFARVERAQLELVDELPSTVRGTGGFGSTGFGVSSTNSTSAPTVNGSSVQET